MHCLRCGVCCKETEMLLSNQDIKRLEKQGNSKDLFVFFDDEGYARLRNTQGHCVFYNVKDHSCRVYRWRPEGCRLYPVVFDEENWIVLDHDCCSTRPLNAREVAARGLKVLKLLEKIDTQAETRARTF